MLASGWRSGFPRLTWVACECGCGWEGEDDVTQWLVEEAAMLAMRADDRKRSDADDAELLLLERHAEMAALRGRVG